MGITSMEQYMGCGEVSMSAQGHFHRRGKPPDFIAAIYRNCKGSLGQVILSSNGLHQVRFQPGIQNTNGCRVPFKRGRGKGVYLIDFLGFHKPAG